MKTLYVVRHAKSSRDDPKLEDLDRPLNDRGFEDAPAIGKRLREKEIAPDLLLTSPAKRTLSTCKLIADALGSQESLIKTEPALYHASPSQMLKIVRKQNDNINSLMVFGHNPGLTDFINELAEKDPMIFNVPTCGAIGFLFNVRSWSEINFGKGKLLFFDYPKNIRG